MLLNSGRLIHSFESSGDTMRYDLATSLFYPLGLVGNLSSDRET